MIWPIYHTLVIVLLIAAIAMMFANFRVFRRLRTATTAEKSPFVSVLVPARNEEVRIHACVGSLLAQDYANYELLVLDDRSEDATPQILDNIGLRENGKKHRRIHGEELPPGWIGKNWACHQLAQNARGEFLLFTDADTIHKPGALQAVVAHALDTRADLLSAWPQQLTGTWSEKVVIPIIHLAGLALFPHPLIPWLQSDPVRAQKLPQGFLHALGIANGQVIFFRRSAYDAIGGHAAVRDHLVEDVALGRAMTRRIGEGMRLVNCDGSELIDCRMYRSFRELWEGFTKNAWPAFEGAHGLWWATGITHLCIFFLPFVLVFFPSQRMVALTEIALIYFIRFVLTLRTRTSWLGCWLHPLGHGIAMLIALNSQRLASRKGVTWKGRTYRAE